MRNKKNTLHVPAQYWFAKHQGASSFIKRFTRHRIVSWIILGNYRTLWTIINRVQYKETIQLEKTVICGCLFFLMVLEEDGSVGHYTIVKPKPNLCQFHPIRPLMVWMPGECVLLLVFCLSFLSFFSPSGNSVFVLLGRLGIQEGKRQMSWYCAKGGKLLSWKMKNETRRNSASS